MSQNAQKLFNYLQENESNPEVFGDFDVFQEQLKDPEKAEKLRNYLGNEEAFGDSATFYNKINEAPIKQQENTLPVDSNIVTTTKDDSGTDILDLEMKNPGASAPALAQINNPDYETNQVIDSSDHGYFQINNKYWDDTSSVLFNKPVQDLNNLENIAIASYIEKKSPNGWNNWVAFNKGKHKDFDGVTDEQLVNTYKVPVDVVQLINESFDDPQTAKQVMLAESGGDSTAINVNYTPQEEGKETVSPEILQQSELLIRETGDFQPEFETAQPSSSMVMTQMQREQFPVFNFTGTQIAPLIQEKTEKILKNVTFLDSPAWDTAELKELKPVVELGVNAISRIAELPGLAIDIPTSLLATPEEAILGLLRFIPDEFNNLALATNTVDVLNPFLAMVVDEKTGKGFDFTKEELDEMRTKAQKHIFDTGGVYTYFAASGLTHLGKKNSKIVEKNKEFADVVELANDRPAKGKVTPEMQKAVETLKKNVELKQKAEVIKNNELLTDYLQEWEVNRKVEKANVLSEQLELKLETKPSPKKRKTKQETKSTEIDLDRDIPSPTKKLNKIKKEVSKVETKLNSVKQKVKKESVKEPATSEFVKEIKIEKSSDLGKAKNLEPIKGEPAKRFNSKEKVDAYIENKLGEYIGQNVVANYGQLKNGNYIVKIFKKTKEQSLPTTATKRPPLKIEKETGAEIVTKMRDPRNLKRRIQNQEMLLEKYESQVSELTRSAQINNIELTKLKQQALETGVESPRAKLLSSSIDATTALIEKTQGEIQLLKSTKEIVKDIGKNIASRTSPGRVGKGARKTTKERMESERLNRELARDINIIFQRGNTGVVKSKKALLKFLKENNASKDIIKHVNDNYKELYDYATIESAKTLANEISSELPQSQGEVRGTRTATRTREEYFGNLRVDVMSGEKPNPQRLSTVELVDALVDNIGAEKVTDAKGTRTSAEIKRGAREQNILSEVVHEVLNNNLSVTNLPEKLQAIVNLTGETVERAARTQNRQDVALAQEFLKSTFSYISEPSRTVRSMRDVSFENFRDLKKYTEQFGDFPEIQDLLNQTLQRKEIKRSRLFKIAEWGRNMKLATGSSIIRSLAGNTMSSVDAYARAPIEFGFDYLIKKTSGALYELSNGYYGNLSPNQMNRLELSAQFAGYRAGFKKTGDLLYDMFLENDAALRESPFFQREGFSYKDIKGFKGKVIRTPQRLQGMIDISYRVPMTNGYMHRYAIRQAIKDGYKTQTEILQRASEIIESKTLDSKLFEQARRDGEYITFQRELTGIGRFANKLRTGNTRGAAVTQMLVPFFNTAGNLFKYTLEHTPLNIFMKDFRQGFVEAFSREGAGSRKLATEFGKMSTGIGTMYLLNEFLVENSAGNITGDWSNKSAEERNMRVVNGEQEYSVKLSDGSFVSYRGFEPVSSYLTLIEALHRTEKDAYSSEENIKKYGEQVKNVTLELAKSFAENPFLAGTGDLFKALHGRKDWASFFTNFTAGMSVPGTYRQILSIVDPVRRKRFKLVDIDENVDIVDVIQSQAESVLPWFIKGENLDALDPFGNIIRKPDPVGGLLAWRRTQPVNDPVYQEIQKIYFDEGRTFKSAGSFFTTSDLAKIKLTPEEHFAIIQASGKETYNFISKLLSIEAYQNLTPAIKRERINEVRKKYVETYRKLLFSKDLTIPAETMKIKELRGEFETPKDREDFLKEMRSQIPRRTVEEILGEYLQ